MGLVKFLLFKAIFIWNHYKHLYLCEIIDTLSEWKIIIL